MTAVKRGVRLNPRHQDMVRDKIMASQIINSLQNHVFGKKLMKEQSQVTAALGLLKKCVPDLASVELSGDVDNPIIAQVTWQVIK
jgi:hypothetical protein